MIRLWLDDVRPMPADYDVHVKTAAGAIEMIDTGKVTAISFDHDLGPADAGTGYDVAKYIEMRSYYKTCAPPMEWRVHSANPVGRQNILRAMESAERYFAAWDKGAGE